MLPLASPDWEKPPTILVVTVPCLRVTVLLRALPLLMDSGPADRLKTGAAKRIASGKA